ncbi:MAG: transcriptional regulator [Pseudonocardiales bacterium]|nr:MAG: transcriptional regulator [Pseudonocardiales bacterium]
MRQPTLRAQWLGRHLRVLREEAGLTLKDTATFLQRDPSTVSRIETAEYSIRRPEVLGLLDFYNVSDGRRRATLMKLGEEVWQKDWWDQYVDERGKQFANFVWLEARASDIQSFDNVVVPGLLQTQEYAEAIMRAADPDSAEAQIQSWIDLRMRRQEVLDRADPPQITMLLDESVLRRQVGSAALSRRQLEHLLVSADRPRVSLRVLPLTIGLHPGATAAFVIFGMPDPYPEIGYVEALAGALYLEPPETEPLLRAYERVDRHALNPAESVRLIARVAKEVERQ